jgi:hypothetical protein
MRPQDWHARSKDLEGRRYQGWNPSLGFVTVVGAVILVWKAVIICKSMVSVLESVTKKLHTAASISLYYGVACTCVYPAVTNAILNMDTRIN